MQSFKILALLAPTEPMQSFKIPELKHLLSEKYPELQNFFKIVAFLQIFFKGSQKFLLVTQKPMQSFKILAFLLLTDSGGYVKFNPKYTTVGGEGGVLEFF